MEKIIKESEARKGVAVTYITKAGGIGFGYLLGEDVYKSGGNGFDEYWEKARNIAVRIAEEQRRQK